MPATPEAIRMGCLCRNVRVSVRIIGMVEHPDCWMHGKAPRARVESDGVRDPQPVRLSGGAT